MQPFRDNYTDFRFAEVDSKTMKVWITNSLDIELNMMPNFSDEHESPQYGNNSYYLGTTIKEGGLPKVRCVAINVSMNEWRAITEWLSPFKKGKLSFSFNKGTFYYAKLSGKPSAVSFVRGAADSLIGDIYTVAFELNFTTIDDYAALGHMAGFSFNEEPEPDTDETVDYLNNMEMLSSANNPYCFPLVFPKSEDTFYLYNTGAYDAYPNFYLESLYTGFKISLNGKGFYQYSLSYPANIKYAKVDGRLGLATNSGQMLESAKDINDNLILQSAVNNGPLMVPSGKPTLIKGKIKKVEEKETGLWEISFEPYVEQELSLKAGDNFSISIFTFDTSGSSTEFFGDGKYSPNFKDFFFAEQPPNNSLKPNAVTKKYSFVVKVLKNETVFDPIAEVDVYFAMCNYSILKIEHPINNNIKGTSLRGSITMNTRGAI